MHEDEVFWAPSDNESEGEKIRRQARRDAIGQRYLRGHAPFILSAQLKGPFDKSSGWKNPWLPKLKADTHLKKRTNASYLQGLDDDDVSIAGPAKRQRDDGHTSVSSLRSDMGRNDLLRRSKKSAVNRRRQVSELRNADISGMESRAAHPVLHGGLRQFIPSVAGQSREPSREQSREVSLVSQPKRRPEEDWFKGRGAVKKLRQEEPELPPLTPVHTPQKDDKILPTKRNLLDKFRGCRNNLESQKSPTIRAASLEKGGSDKSKTLSNLDPFPSILNIEEPPVEPENLDLTKSIPNDAFNKESSPNDRIRAFARTRLRGLRDEVLQSAEKPAAAAFEKRSEEGRVGSAKASKPSTSQCWLPESCPVSTLEEYQLDEETFYGYTQAKLLSRAAVSLPPDDFTDGEASLEASNDVTDEPKGDVSPYDGASVRSGAVEQSTEYSSKNDFDLIQPAPQNEQLSALPPALSHDQQALVDRIVMTIDKDDYEEAGSLMLRRTRKMRKAGLTSTRPVSNDETGNAPAEGIPIGDLSKSSPPETVTETETGYISDTSSNGDIEVEDVQTKNAGDNREQSVPRHQIPPSQSHNAAQLDPRGRKDAIKTDDLHHSTVPRITMSQCHNAADLLPKDRLEEASLATANDRSHIEPPTKSSNERADFAEPEKVLHGSSVSPAKAGAHLDATLPVIISKSLESSLARVSIPKTQDLSFNPWLQSTQLSVATSSQVKSQKRVSFSLEISSDDNLSSPTEPGNKDSKQPTSILKSKLSQRRSRDWSSPPPADYAESHLDSDNAFHVRLTGLRALNTMRTTVFGEPVDTVGSSPGSGGMAAAFLAADKANIMAAATKAVPFVKHSSPALPTQLIHAKDTEALDEQLPRRRQSSISRYTSETSAFDSDSGMKTPAINAQRQPPSPPLILAPQLNPELSASQDLFTNHWATDDSDQDDDASRLPPLGTLGSTLAKLRQRNSEKSAADQDIAPPMQLVEDEEDDMQGVGEVSDLLDDWNLTTELEKAAREARKEEVQGLNLGKQTTARERMGSEMRL